MDKKLEIIISVLEPLVKAGIISSLDLDRIKNIPDNRDNRDTARSELDTYLTINETCKLMRVSRRTIYNWMNTGKLEYTRLSPKKILIFERSIIRMIKEQKMKHFST